MLRHVPVNNHRRTGVTQTSATIQGVSRLEDIIAAGDFLGLSEQKIHINVSDFGRLRSYGHFLIPVHALV